MAEQVFRAAKSLLDTRPIFHKTDATICGHVFCSLPPRWCCVTSFFVPWTRSARAPSGTTTYNGKSFAVCRNTVGVASKIA